MYPLPNQRVIVKDDVFLKNFKSKEINKLTIYVDLGVAEYADDYKLVSWKPFAEYEPVELNIYYEHHLFRKNKIELR